MVGELDRDIARVAMRITEFWRNVHVTSTAECWLWTGYAQNGYGRYFFQGAMRGAHELALTFTTGEVRLNTLDTCHLCDTPLCCNPGHLRFGARLSNVADMHDRGRGLRGEAHPSSRLTREIVREIRERRNAGAQQKSLAVQYGISVAYVSEIVNGLVWQDAGGPIGGRSKRTKRNKNSRIGKAA